MSWRSTVRSPARRASSRASSVGLGATFFDDAADWNEVVFEAEVFETTAANLLAFSPEVTSLPGPNEQLGTEISVLGALASGRDFVMRTLEPGQNFGFVFDDDEFPGQSDLLSINDVNNGEDDDFEIVFSGSGTRAFGFTVYDDNQPGRGIESLSVYGPTGALIGRLDLSTVDFSTNQFLGVIAPQAISRVVFDEDATGDDIGLRTLVFGDAYVELVASLGPVASHLPADSACPTCPSGAQSVVVTFTNTSAMRVGQVAITATFDGNHLPEEPTVGVRFHRASGGLPVEDVASYSSVPASLLGVGIPPGASFDTYRIPIVLPSPAVLPAGQWSVEVWDETPAFMRWRRAAGGSGNHAVSPTVPGFSWTAPVPSAQGVSISAFGVFERHSVSVGRSGTGTGTVTSSPGSIDCGATCADEFLHGTAFSLTAIPDAGTVFVGWGGDCSGTGPVLATATASISCVAIFQAERQVTVTPVGSGFGTVTSSPAGIDCGGDCSEIYPDYAAVTLTATADLGSAFVGWEGDPACSSSPLQVLGSDVICSPRFERDRLLLVTTEPGGTVTGPGGIDCPDEACLAFLPWGTDVVLHPHPDSGFFFTGWDGEGCGTGWFPLVEDQECTARFAPRSLWSPAAVFFDGSSDWESLLVWVEDFATTPNLPLADEVASPPSIGSWLGDTLTFAAASTGLRESFRLRTLEGNPGCSPPNCGWRLRESGPWSGISGSLSPNGIGFGEDDDFEIFVGTERPVTAIGFWIIHSDTSAPGVETLSVYGEGDALLGQVDLSAYALGSALERFVGVATAERIVRVVFDEDAGGDDIAIRDLRFGEASVIALRNETLFPNATGTPSDSDCCGGGSQAIAETFVLTEPALVGQVDVWGSFAQDVSPALDRIRTTSTPTTRAFPARPSEPRASSSSRPRGSAPDSSPRASTARSSPSPARRRSLSGPARGGSSSSTTAPACSTGSAPRRPPVTRSRSAPAPGRGRPSPRTAGATGCGERSRRGPCASRRAAAGPGRSPRRRGSTVPHPATTPPPAAVSSRSTRCRTPG